MHMHMYPQHQHTLVIFYIIYIHSVPMVDGEKNKWHSGVGDGVNCESLKVYYKQHASDSA